MRIVGLLLAAGFSRRYGANKLIQRLPDGTLMAVAAGRNLVAALPDSIAVVRQDVPELVAALREAGLRITECDTAQQGMGASLAHGVRAALDADGWVVALGDMPFVQPATIRAVADSVAAGNELVAPRYAGERGHPVGFAARYRDELAKLTGDEGARYLLKRDTVTLVNCADPGVIRDIDTPGDLPG
jgi:molybdenum cofactor cytidylyltransferase